MKTLIKPLADLHPDPNQPRKTFPDETLAELAQSLREVGILFPLRVRPNGAGYVIVDGERRFHAARLAGLSELPVIVEEAELSEPDVTRRQLIANCQREDLKPLEVARGVQSLMTSAGWTASEAARRLGFSESKVSRLLALLSLPQDVQARIESGAISPSAGYALSQVDDAAAQSQLARDAASGRITRDAIVSRSRRRPVSPSAKVPARITARLGQGRSVTLAGPGLADVETLITWLTELVNEARKARDLELTTFARLLRDRAKPGRKAEG